MGLRRGASWKDVIAHREEVLLEDIEIFSNYLVEERSNGLNHINYALEWEGVLLAFGSEIMLTTTNVDFDTDILRYSYQSLATPSSVIDFNMKTKEKKSRKSRKFWEANLIKIII
jgi:oligopeptidase B